MKFAKLCHDFEGSGLPTNLTVINDELDILISNKKQKHAINSQKVSVLSRRKFAELIFGEDHPYGIDVKNEHFDLINVSIICKPS